MIFRRLYHDRLAQASYILACEATRQAIVIDPLRDPEPYLEAAALDDVRIAFVSETHLHADFLSGAEALAARTGATLLLSAEGDDTGIEARLRRTDATALRTGDAISVGRVRLDVRHTPGHTPEHLVFIVTDEATSPLPVGMLSGDFLFAGDVGRPDLLERAVGVKDSMHRSAAQLFHSLQTLRELPDYLQVWPGHGAGSACGKSLGAVPQTTLGYELRTNWAFQVADEAEFVREVLADQPDPPAYFALMKALNARGVPAMPSAAVADEGTLRAAVRGGVLVVDTRAPSEFLAEHLEEAINIPLGRSFLTWAGSVLDPEREIVLLMSPAERHLAPEAIHDLALIGFDRVLGAIAATDLGTLSPRDVSSIPVVPAADIGATPNATIIDVRSETEWNEGHIPGARHFPLTQLAARAEELRALQPIVVHCQGGARSSIAVSVLRAFGIHDVTNADGGYAAWERTHGSAVRVP
ncbi:MAG TPA: MBL fold metallo-hydrolase [Gemmatimonadaceae bacterium]